MGADSQDDQELFAYLLLHPEDGVRSRGEGTPEAPKSTYEVRSWGA